MFEPCLEVPLPLWTEADRDPLVAVMTETVGLTDRIVPHPQCLGWVEESSGQITDSVVELHVVEVLASFHRVPVALGTERTPAFSTAFASTGEARCVEIAGEQIGNLFDRFFGLMLDVDGGTVVVLRVEERVCGARVGKFLVARARTWPEHDFVGDGEAKRTTRASGVARRRRDRSV